MKGLLRAIRVNFNIGATRVITLGTGLVLPDDRIRSITNFCIQRGLIPSFVPEKADEQGVPAVCLEVECVAFGAAAADETLPEALREIAEKGIVEDPPHE